MRHAFLEANTQPRGTLTCAVDARELFHDGWLASGEWFTDLSERIAATRVAAMSLRHTIRVSILTLATVAPLIIIIWIQKRLGQQTTLKVVSKISQTSLDDGDEDPANQSSRYSTLRGNIIGIVNHQYSSKLVFEVRNNTTC